jgi:hypothetical protein
MISFMSIVGSMAVLVEQKTITERNGIAVSPMGIPRNGSLSALPRWPLLHQLRD